MVPRIISCIFIMFYNGDIMKKILTVLICIALIVSLCACGANNEKPVVVLGAMECETQALIDMLEKPKETKIGVYNFIEGKIDGHPVVVCRCYVGMVNATAATTCAVENFDPRCVIIQGTVGGHNPDLHKNDILLGEDMIQMACYWTEHKDEGEGSNYAEWEYRGAEVITDNGPEYVLLMHSDEELLKIAESVPYNEGKVVRGTIGTADVWNKEIDLINFYHENLGTDGEEMECYAVAQTCYQLGVPSLAVKIISNSELHPDEVFDEQTGVICQNYVADVIRAIFA